jgi:virginiamycin B lyase
MRALASGAVGLLISAVSLGVVAGPAVHQYSVPPAGGSIQISSGSGVELVFPGPNANVIGRITVDGVVSQRKLPTANSRPFALARESDPRQRIVFTETGTNRIGVIDSAGNLTEYDIPTLDSDPRGVAAPSLIWFTEYDGNRIGRLDPGSGAIVDFPVPTPNAGPLGIASSSGGDVWFTEFLGNKIGRIDANGVITEYAIPTPDSGPTAIVEAQDEDGNIFLYFTESKANKIGRITTAGVFREFPVPTPGSGLSDIVADFDGVWFAERFAGKLGRLSFDETFDEFQLPGSRPDGIAITSLNSDNSAAPRSIWWIDGTNKIIGRLSANRIYAVGAGHDATFDTEFDLSSADGQPLKARVGITPGVCPAACVDPGAVVSVPSTGTVTKLASDIPQTDGVQLYVVTGQDFAGIDELPATEAFLIDEGDGSRAELPLIDYWTVADSQPPANSATRQPSLTFPARRRPGAHTDLILADIESAGPLSVRIDAVRAGVGIVATTTRLFAGTLVLNNILTTMGIFDAFEGQLVVRRQSFSGLFWGLAEITDGNQLFLAEPGATLPSDGDCTVGPARCGPPRTTRVVTRH